MVTRPDLWRRTGAVGPERPLSGPRETSASPRSGGDDQPQRRRRLQSVRQVRRSPRKGNLFEPADLRKTSRDSRSGARKAVSFGHPRKFDPSYRTMLPAMCFVVCSFADTWPCSPARTVRSTRDQTVTRIRRLIHQCENLIAHEDTSEETAGRTASTGWTSRSRREHRKLGLNGLIAGKPERDQHLVTRFNRLGSVRQHDVIIAGCKLCVAVRRHVQV